MKELWRTSGDAPLFIHFWQENDNDDDMKYLGRFRPSPLVQMFMGLVRSVLQSTQRKLFSFFCLWKPIEIRFERNLPQFGAHTSRLRYYDVRWVMLPTHSFFLRNRQCSRWANPPSHACASTDMLPQRTNTWDAFAAAPKVMRPLRTASTASPAHSTSTLPCYLHV